ncbi:MAG: hypothetical protein EA361_09210 [Bacteroidetes bacterium]|nr:MAG: hypothetical protein EA361_09210 [Bacteroidota bacterium]
MINEDRITLIFDERFDKFQGGGEIVSKIKNKLISTTEIKTTININIFACRRIVFRLTRNIAIVSF